MTRLPDTFWSWAYTPWHVAQCDKQQSSGLILPGDYCWNADASNTDPALVHFSSFNEDGSERNWLWLFGDNREAIRLKLLPEFAAGAEADLIDATLPRSSPDEPERLYLQAVPRRWLFELPLAEVGISEIWYGFNHRRYNADRRMAIATQKLSLEEFQGWCKTSV